MAFIVEEKNEVATFIIAIQVLLMRSKTKYIYIHIYLHCGRKLPISLMNSKTKIYIFIMEEEDIT